jgi:gamma-glutamyltranspeptidase/glutathione hydrolase
MTLTLMGGDMQPQGHAQVLVNMIDLGANVQAASDMARFHHEQIPNVLELESPLFDVVGSALGAMGHNVHSADGGNMGGFQSILVQTPPKEGPGSKEQRVYRGGSDHRKDGQAVGW